ncbi:hypothetical protein ACIRN5_23600, partial [Lysinibacillus fusiformis]|uniref:hypothetical protein n=2 Tax=Bacillati TaxID=1783272 RepID=UPI003810F1DE
FAALATAVAAAGLALPVGADATTAPVPAPVGSGQSTSGFPKPNLYVSPYGEAKGTISAETRAWLAGRHATLGTIAPWKTPDNGKTFSLPIGTEANDTVSTLEGGVLISYPAGFTFRFPQDDGHDTVVDFAPTYIRLAPTDWSVTVVVDGAVVAEKIPMGTISTAGSLATLQPTLTGYKLSNVDVYWTKQMSELLAGTTNGTGPTAGSLALSFTPYFDSVPGVHH